jgi:NADPH:quinone reductase-like Zn-dependent oxidoreductase
MLAHGGVGANQAARKIVGSEFSGEVAAAGHGASRTNLCLTAIAGSGTHLHQ